MTLQNVVSGPSYHHPPILTSVGTFLHQHLTKHDPKSIALINEESQKCVTFGELLQNACKLAISLERFGITGHNVTAICSENHINYYIPVVACLYAGVALTFFNANYTADELDHVLVISEPSLVFVSSKSLKRFVGIRHKYPSIKTLIVLDDIYTNSATNLTKFIECSETYALTYKPPEVDLEHTAFIMWSSGTTGLPKGVCISHKNINAKHMMLFDKTNQSVYDVKVSLGVLPFFHAFGLHVGIISLILGHKLIVLEKFQPMTYLSCIEKYKIPDLSMPPSLAVFLAKSPLASKFDLSHVQEIVIGAAPASKELEEEIKRRFGIKRIRQGYGLTEATVGLTFQPVEYQKQGSCGKAIPGTSLVIKDLVTGENLGPNRQGEICCKSDTVMKGYYKDEDATRATFTENGWLRTGDVGYYDEDGYFYIVDRLKELIKYKGFQVAPAELEKILTSHPQINDVAVVGLPDSEVGEKPMAFVVCESSSKLTEEGVSDYLKKFVSRNKYLHGGVRFVNEIPRNPSGKILRRKVREMARNLKSKL